MTQAQFSVAFATVMNHPNCGGLCSHLALLHAQLTGRGISSKIVDGTVSHKRFHQLVTALQALVQGNHPRVAWLKRRPTFIRHRLRETSEAATLVHAHDPIAAVAALGLGKPVITTIHGPMSRHAQEEPGLPKAYIDELKRIEAACYQHTSHFITVDTGQRTILTEAGVEGHRITIIPNAVDVSGLQAAAAHGRRIDDSAYFILPRRLVPKNGPIIALEAFLEWVGERDVKLLVAGDGPLLERMKSICLNHAEGRKVIFAGMVPTADMPPLVANALAALVPSVPYQGVIEATSIAALEALALNVPVIASDIGGLSEIDRGTGIVTLVPANCGPALKAEMERTYNQRSAPRGTHRETHVRKNFGAERWIESHLEIYESTLTE